MALETEKKPRTDNQTLHPHRKQSLLSALETFRQLVEGLPVQKSCSTCQHFSAPACTRWNAQPPADIQAVGCEAWEFDALSPPF